MHHAFLDDVQSAARSLCRAPAFALTAVLTLAVGVAGTVAMIALVRGVLLRPLPVRDQARVVLAWSDLPASGYTHAPFGANQIAALDRAGSRSFEAVAGVDTNGTGSEVVEEDGRTTTLDGSLVAGRFFDVLGTTAVLGRALTAADDVDGAEPVLVIGYALWQQRYGGSPAVIGRRLTLDDTRFTIVGVMPSGLDYPVGAQLWRPVHSVPLTRPFALPARQEVDLVGRLRPGVTLDQARAELAALFAVLERDVAANVPRGYVPVVQRFEDAIVGGSRRPLALLLAAVLLVLVVACANVANLLLMRAESRRVEVAVQLAIGAGRARLARQVALECGMLSVAAVAIGGPLGFAVLRALLELAPVGLPRLDAVRLDGVVAAAIVLLPAATTLLASLPAMGVVASGGGLMALNAASARVGAGISARRGRRALVVAQVAMAVTVVAAASVLGRSLWHLSSIEPGLAAGHLLFAELTFPDPVEGGPTHAQRLDRVTARLRALPGVAAVAPVNGMPYAGGWDVPAFTVEGQDERTAAANPALNLESIKPSHFATLGVPMRRGRPFTDDDRYGQPLVVIVSEDVAARTWPGRDPIGQRLKFGGASSTEAWRTVVGVAAGIRYRELATPAPTLYLPAAQFIDTAERLAIRTAGDPSTVAAGIRRQLEGVEPGVAVLSVTRFDDIRARSLARPRFLVTIAGLFAAAAGLLAAVGLFAALAASVRQRTREIAIRIAVGATPPRIRRLIGREALWLAGTGACLGAVVAIVAAPLLSKVVVGVAPDDPFALGAAVAGVLGAAIVAAWWPVRRAMRVDAATTLRQ
jgi:putative ABC transport system permease protein